MGRLQTKKRIRETGQIGGSYPTNNYRVFRLGGQTTYYSDINLIINITRSVTVRNLSIVTLILER